MRLSRHPALLKSIRSLRNAKRQLRVLTKAHRQTCTDSLCSLCPTLPGMGTMIQMMLSYLESSVSGPNPPDEATIDKLLASLDPPDRPRIVPSR